MISIPIAVHNDSFQWQLDLFWYNHKLTYGAEAKNNALAVIIKRNFRWEPKHEHMQWELDIPHAMCESFFDVDDTFNIAPTVEIPLNVQDSLALPLNIQIGLAQVIDRFDGEQIIELLDCDMFHFRPHANVDIRDNQIIVDDVYEAWHLKSLSSNRTVIDVYFENGGRFYNGGFVPIIAKAKTFKKILPEWIAIHRHILAQPFPENIHWWAGMFALQAACEKNKVRMIAEDYCYVSGTSLSPLRDTDYIAHYCVDPVFNKKKYPDVDPASFPSNAFYERVTEWLETQSSIPN